MSETKPTGSTDSEIENNTQDRQTESSVQAPQAETDISTNLDVKPNDQKPHKKNIFKNKIVLLSLIAFIVICCVIGYVLFVSGNSKKNNKAASTTSSQQSSIDTKKPATAASQATADKVSLSGNTFYSTAKKVGDLNFFKDLSYFGHDCSGVSSADMSMPGFDPAKCPNINTSGDISYYEIGSTKDKRIIYIITAKAEGPGESSLQSFIAIGKDKTYLILTETSEELKKALNSTVTIDSSTQIADLKLPATATVNGQKIAIEDYNFASPEGIDSVSYMFGKLSNKEKLGSFGIYDLFRFTSNDSTNFKTYKLYATLNGYWTAGAKQNGEIMASVNENKNAPIAWSKGETGKYTYVSQGPGCGSGTYIVAKNVTKSDLIVAGKTSSGQSVYELPTGNGLVNELYQKDYANGEGVDDAALKNLSLQQFTNKHAYFVAEDAWGDWIIYLRADLFVRGGCAKPVVYLYPVTTTSVKVAVGAQVTKSEPLYPDTGWQNVIAQPNGSLTYKGRQYGSLFWEGYGNGDYPTITSGTVVNRSDAPSVIRKQLLQQGLNTKETEDFMAYWTSLIPTDPYVRISWLTKNQIDRLAPLTITPVPQSVIRVFLDMEGLSKPITIPAQVLITPRARSGFTAVEWGGLRVDGKIY